LTCRWWYIKSRLGFPRGYSMPSLVLFLGGKKSPNMRWANNKKGNIG